MRFVLALVAITAASASAGCVELSPLKPIAGAADADVARDAGALGDAAGTDVDDEVAIHRPTIVELAVGSNFVLARADDGAVYAWGSSAFAELGDGVAGWAHPPHRIKGLPDGVTAVTAGNKHACALDGAGQAWCWGDNRWGQVAAGPEVVPRPVVVQTGIARIHADNSTTCADLEAGNVVCWGLPYNVSTIDLPPTPYPEPLGLGLDRFDAIAMSTNTVCAVKDGDLFCRGMNAYGTAGVGQWHDIPVDYLAPVDVPPMDRLVAGEQHFCAVSQDGKLWCWGSNIEGQVGSGTQIATTPVEVTIPTSDPIVEVVAHYRSSCAIDLTGRIFCLGLNQPTILDGVDSNHHTFNPTNMSHPELFGMAAGAETRCGLEGEGVPFCYGQNLQGQLGQGVAGSLNEGPFEVVIEASE